MEILRGTRNLPYLDLEHFHSQIAPLLLKGPILAELVGSLEDAPDVDDGELPTSRALNIYSAPLIEEQAMRPSSLYVRGYQEVGLVAVRQDPNRLALTHSGRTLHDRMNILDTQPIQEFEIEIMMQKMLLRYHTNSPICRPRPDMKPIFPMLDILDLLQKFDTLSPNELAFLVTGTSKPLDQVVQSIEEYRSLSITLKHQFLTDAIREAMGLTMPQESDSAIWQSDVAERMRKAADNTLLTLSATGLVTMDSRNRSISYNRYRRAEVLFLLGRREQVESSVASMTSKQYVRAIGQLDHRAPLTLSSIPENASQYNRELLDFYKQLQPVVEIPIEHIADLETQLANTSTDDAVAQKEFSKQLLGPLQRSAYLANIGIESLLAGIPNPRLHADASRVVAEIQKQHLGRNKGGNHPRSSTALQDRIGNVRYMLGEKVSARHLLATLWESSIIQLFAADDDFLELWVGLKADLRGHLAMFAPGLHPTAAGTQVGGEQMVGADGIMLTSNSILVIEPFARESIDHPELHGISGHLAKVADLAKQNNDNRPVVAIGCFKDADEVSLMLTRGVVTQTARAARLHGITNQHLILLPRKAAVNFTEALLHIENQDEVRLTWLLAAIELANNPDISNEFWGAWLEQSPKTFSKEPNAPSAKLRERFLAFVPRLTASKMAQSAIDLS